MLLAEVQLKHLSGILVIATQQAGAVLLVLELSFHLPGINFFLCLPHLDVANMAFPRDFALQCFGTRLLFFKVAFHEFLKLL